MKIFAFGRKDALQKRARFLEWMLKKRKIVGNVISLWDRLVADVSSGIRTIDLIERSAARIPMYQNLNTIKVDTSRKTVQMITEELKIL